jgi:hypothetical protein
MSTINAVNNTYTNLSHFLNNNSSKSKNTGSDYSSLADLMNTNDNNTSSDNNDDLYALLMDNSGIRKYALPTDSNGNTFIPTANQMNNADTPDKKLTLAQYVAQFILVQADASSKTDNATRVKDIAGQADEVLNAISSAITGMAGGDTSDKATYEVTAAQQTTISKTLNTISTILTEVKNLLSKASPDMQASMTKILANLDDLASKIAKATGVAWTSVTGNDDNTVKGYSAESSNSSVNYDSLSSLLNVTA